MSGRIGVHSDPARGATFWIELPVAEANPEKNVLPARGDLERLNRSVGDFESATILCIEDNDSNFHLIERTFAERPGIKLVAGTVGRTAVSLAETHRPNVILLDVHLPDMEGNQVLENLRNNPATARIPVIVISADGTQRQMDRMFQAGASAYLTKPLDIQQFLKAVDQARAGDSR